MAELPKPGSKGICPHCGKEARFLPLDKDINEIEKIDVVYRDNESYFRFLGSKCSMCEKIILIHQRYNCNIETSHWEYKDNAIIWPQGITRHAPPEIPKEIAKNYEEAYAVLNKSETATALLARRCLQHIIHDAAKQHDRHLDKEIEAIKDSLPDDLKEMPTLIRLLGKIAAHPMKDSQTGEILTVEPEEAEFALTIIEYLFDHYYVKPAKQKKLADQIKAKTKKSPKKK